MQKHHFFWLAFEKYTKYAKNYKSNKKQTNKHNKHILFYVLMQIKHTKEKKSIAVLKLKLATIL